MTISDFSRDAVCRYLRSVVLIDDNLFNVNERHSSQDDFDLDGPPILILNKDGVAPDLATMAIDAEENDRRADDNWVDARSVTDGFAKKGIVCGVYAPKEFPATNFESGRVHSRLASISRESERRCRRAFAGIYSERGQSKYITQAGSFLRDLYG